MPPERETNVGFCPQQSGEHLQGFLTRIRNLGTSGLEENLLRPDGGFLQGVGSRFHPSGSGLGHPLIRRGIGSLARGISNYCQLGVRNGCEGLRFLHRFYNGGRIAGFNAPIIDLTDVLLQAIIEILLHLQFIAQRVRLGYPLLVLTSRDASQAAQQPAYCQYMPRTLHRDQIKEENRNRPAEL